MFEDRLWLIKKKSSTLRENLGKRPLRLTDLKKACQEFALAYGYKFILLPLPRDIGEQKIRGYSYATKDHYYVVNLNYHYRLERLWYFGAHEMSHVLLHHLYLGAPFKDSRQEIEEEAHFFAQLCFWPLDYIFSDQYCIEKSMDEEMIIKVLVNFQKDFFDLNDFHYVPHKLHLFAYLFLRRMERFLPFNYQKLMNSYYPILSLPPEK